ncbi:MAG: 2-phosphosulfolactate phosphatase [Bacteroidetes bacterium]|nr:2-phosphosulfolactate phosphatase [Bacteroidota bacterium]
MDALPKLEVCLSPALLHLFDTNGAVVVIIDVFRATSTIVAALHSGAQAVIPVASVEECIQLGRSVPNSITGGERNGAIIPGLQHGNSPLEYPASFIAGKKLVLTTTNGTKLLHMVEGAAEIITGSFLNLSSVCEFLLERKLPVVLGCAAWKDRVNLEDMLFAGAVVQAIGQYFSVDCDSARAARQLYELAKPDLLGFLKDSSHYKRLSAFGLEKDLQYCTTLDLHPLVPILKGRELVVAR